MTATETQENVEANTSSDSFRSTDYLETVFYAAVIGIVGGLVAIAYYFVLEAFLHTIWHTVPDFLEPYFPSWLPVWSYLPMLPLIAIASFVSFFLTTNVYMLKTQRSRSLQIVQLQRLEPTT